MFVRERKMTSPAAKTSDTIEQAAAAAIEQALAIQRATTVATEIEGVVRGVDATTENLATLVQRLSDKLDQEIEGVIAELQGVRTAFLEEAQRLERDVAGYNQKSEAAMSSMTVILDSLAPLRGPTTPAPARDSSSTR